MSNIPGSRKFAGKLSRYGNADAAPPMAHHSMATAVVREAGPQTQDVIPSGNSSDGQPALCTVRVASGNVDTVPTAVTHSVATDTHNTRPRADQVVQSTTPSIGSKRSHSPESFDPSKHVRVYTTLKNKRGRSPSPPPIQGPLPPHIIRAPVPTPRPDAKRFKADTSKAMSPSLPPLGGRFGSTQRRRFGLMQQDNARKRTVLSSDAILALLVQNNLQDSTTANVGDSAGNPTSVERLDVVEPSLRPAEIDSAPAAMQVVELDLENEDADDHVDNNAADGETSARNPVMTQTVELPPSSANTEGACEGTKLQGSWGNAGAMLSGDPDRGQRMNCSPRHSNAESASAGLQVVELELDSQIMDDSVDHNTDGSVALPGNSGMAAGIEGPSSCLSIELHSEKEDWIDDDVDNSTTENSTASPIVLCSEDDNKAGRENEAGIATSSDLLPTIEVLAPISIASEVDEEENWEDIDDDMFFCEQDTMDADDSEVDMLLKEEEAPLADSSPHLVYDADQEDGQECEVVDDDTHVNAAPTADVILRDEYTTEAACKASLLSTDDTDQKDEEGRDGVHDYAVVNGGPTAGTLPCDEDTTEAAYTASLPNADDVDDEDWEDVDTEVDGGTATGIILIDENTTKTACEPSFVDNKKPSASSKDKAIREEVKADEEVPLSALSPSTGSAPRPKTVRPPFEPFVVGSEVPQRISFFPAMPPAPSAPSSHTTRPQVHSVPAAEAPTHPNHSTQLGNQSPPKLPVAPQDHVSPDIPAASDSHQHQPKTVAPNSESVHQASQVSTTIPGIAHSQLLQPPFPQPPPPHVAPLTPFAQRTPRQSRSQAERNQRKSSSRKALERFQQPADALDVGVPLDNSTTGQVNAVVDEINTDIIMADPINETGDGTHSQGEVDIPEDDDVVRKYKDLVSNPTWLPNYNRISPVNENIGRARRGGVSSPSRIKHTVQHRTKDRIVLQEDIHRLAKELLKLSTGNLRVPSAQEVLLFEKGNGSTVGPRIEDLVLDLDRNGIASSWNKKAAELFVSEFISRKVSPCTDRRVIQEAFNTYLLALQRTYKKQVLMTSADEAAKVSGRDQAKQRAGYNRRSYKLGRRNGSFKEYAHIPGVAEIIDELGHIPVDAMSGDEMDYVDGKAYLINTKCDWRSKDGDDLFDICDALYMSTRFRPDGRPTNGRFPDPRTASTRPDTLPAPAGLPSNLYNTQYLSGLTDEEKRKLDMRPAFKFLIPVELLRIAERYRRVKTRQMMPLSRDHPRLTQYTQPGTSLLKM
ncbi:hypothetical protein HYPSUDRAFT_59061 [Hypholoma sublateritium FD-334 SS-4]|uniref:Uncharacterized protein n=1 Tax=Hypholoma sublateritium (strain FD-334 SS-4) TaxID=945553 RepID=A0A0D2NEA1_HYPSF|nr:hypothetical protein HYPSUDRAFT_59061 [Hypholoma sublateritium FD-334 SS-4]